MKRILYVVGFVSVMSELDESGWVFPSVYMYVFFFFYVFYVAKQVICDVKNTSLASDFVYAITNESVSRTMRTCITKTRLFKYIEKFTSKN